MELQERRRHVRYTVHCPVLFSWTASDGVRHACEGYTHDLANNGAFILAVDDRPSTHSIVLFDIQLPKLVPTGPRLHIEGRGEVVRVQESGATAGFAVHGNRRFRITPRRSEHADTNA